MRKNRHSMKRFFFFSGILFNCLVTVTARSQTTASYTDTSHYSRVFGHSKSYRLYLPEGYSSSGKRYPVIYFFHGWGGRHFKDDNALLNYEGIKTLVDQYQVILVMWDGNIDTTEPRPYNIGNHRDVKFTVQEKDYFPELIAHIDAGYRTLTDREHRGIIGFSMGGFMSFFLAGKYPDKISAAVSLAGSPEFFVGYPDNHTLYPVRYTFANLGDVKTRLHNGDSDILYYLNEEVKEGARWEGVPLDYWTFPGGHMVDQPGETRVFEIAMKFVTDAFSNPAGRKPRWSHYDLYSCFSAWDYTVETNKKEPGYLFLSHVDKNGFGLRTQRWLPDGPSLAADSIIVITAPLYQPKKEYHIVRYKNKTGQLKTEMQSADANGRLSFFYRQGETETGIYTDSDSSSFVVIDYQAGGKGRYLHSGQTEDLFIRLFNRGNIRYQPGKLKVTISSTDTAVHFKKQNLEITVAANQRIITLPPFVLQCDKKPPPHAEPPQVRFTVRIQSGNQAFIDNFTAPVLYEAPLLDSIRVDDRPAISSQSAGTINGNGIADAGEQIVLYSGSHRLRLYTEDKWVVADEERLADEMIPARWPDGYTLSSVVKIAPGCPDGHIIEFYASYETKTFNPIERKTIWGKVKLAIQNKRPAKP